MSPYGTTPGLDGCRIRAAYIRSGAGRPPSLRCIVTIEIPTVSEVMSSRIDAEEGQGTMTYRRVSTGVLHASASDVHRNLALIEKGQQLAGHFPSDSDLDRARRILTGELAPEAARIEMRAALQELVAAEHAHSHAG